MNYATVEQNQINIPSIIKKKLKLHDGDTFEIRESNGSLMLIPRIKTRIRKNLNEKSDLFDMLGANKNSGLYESAEDIDNYISNLRKEWD